MRILVMALMVALTLPVAASNSLTTAAYDLHFMPGGAVLFHTLTARTDVPACAASQTSRWAIDIKTETGKAQLAGLLTAQSTGKRVSVFGTGACDVWADTESVSYLLVH